MAATHTLLLLPGDGIGPEVMRQARRLIEWMGKRRGLHFEIEEGLIGGAAFDAQGTPLADATLDLAAEADAILLGAVGGPKWADLPFEKRPETGLLRLRKDLDLFANLRPAKVFDALVDASTLKPDVIRGLDMMIVRELTSGVYFGEPRGIEELSDGQRRGFNTQSYTTEEIQRVAAVAFDLARQRQKKVCSVEKSNVMESGLLWREEVVALHEAEYEDVELSHMLADACAMQIVRAPKQFDVVLTDNLFGDILSDEAAMLTGSIGMLPSASLGEADDSGWRPALYEPVHGSAPDIAGRDLANPIAMMLSFGMALRYSFDRPEEADLLEQAVQNVLKTGMRTSDIMQTGMARCGTNVMADTILRELDKLVA